MLLPGLETASALCGSQEEHHIKLTRPVEPECRDHCSVLQSCSILLKYQIKRLGKDPTPLIGEGLDMQESV